MAKDSDELKNVDLAGNVEDIIAVLGEQRAIGISGEPVEVDPENVVGSLEAMAQRLDSISDSLRRRDEVPLPTVLPVKMNDAQPNDDDDDWNEWKDSDDEHFTSDGVESSKSPGVKTVTGGGAGDEGGEVLPVNGEWYWFYHSDIDKTISTYTQLFPAGNWNEALVAHTYYPEMPAGRTTRVRACVYGRAAAAAGITAGTLAFYSRTGPQADSRDDGEIDVWTPAAAAAVGLTVSVNSNAVSPLAANASSVFTEGMAFGAYVITDGSFAHTSSKIGVRVGFYVEEN